jgi:hypothetical protein
MTITLFFWSDRWLEGKTISDLASNLIKIIPKRAITQPTVAQALVDHHMVSDINGTLTVSVLRECLYIWELVDGLILQPGVADQHWWKFTKSGQYSCKSAINAFILGRVLLSRLGKGFGKAGSPYDANFSFGLR